MQTERKTTYRGRDYRVLHSIHMRYRDHGRKRENYHFIEIFHAGHLCRVRVVGYESEAPKVIILAPGSGWLPACEILTTWDDLTPEQYLFWC